MNVAKKKETYISEDDHQFLYDILADLEGVRRNYLHHGDLAPNAIRRLRRFVEEHYREDVQ